MEDAQSILDAYQNAVDNGWKPNETAAVAPRPGDSPSAPPAAPNGAPGGFLARVLAHPLTLPLLVGGATWALTGRKAVAAGMAGGVFILQRK